MSVTLTLTDHEAADLHRILRSAGHLPLLVAVEMAQASASRFVIDSEDWRASGEAQHVDNYAADLVSRRCHERVEVVYHGHLMFEAWRVSDRSYAWRTSSMSAPAFAAMA
jgi:hypothetical protein